MFASSLVKRSSSRSRSRGGLLPVLQYQGDPGGDPAIEENAHQEPDGAGDVACQHIGQPVFAFIDARKADGQNIHHTVHLKWNENPAILPGAHRRREAEEKQEAIIGDIVFGMAGWKALFWTVQHNVDVFVERAGTRTSHQQNVEKVEAAG